MAIIHPQNASARHPLERLILEMLKVQLDDSWHVFPNARIACHVAQDDGESDFILVCPIGIMILEVKGGVISFDFNKGWMRDRKALDDPISQANENRYSVRNFIKERFSRRLLDCFCCVFPESVHQSQSLGHKDGEIIDVHVIRGARLGISLEIFMRGLIKSAENYKPLTQAEVMEVCKILYPDCPGEVGHSESVHLSKIEVSKLEEEQLYEIGTLLRNDRVCLEGSAGTAKTILGVFAGMRRLKENPSIMCAFLCWSEGLASDVRTMIDRHGLGERFKVHSQAALALKCANEIYVRSLDYEVIQVVVHPTELGTICFLLGRDPGDLNGKALMDFIGECSESGLGEAFSIDDPLFDWDSTNPSFLRKERRYDFIVVDEGQDFQNHKGLVALTNMAVKGGLKCGKVLWIRDPDQAIMGAFEPSFSGDEVFFDPESHHYALIERPPRNYRNPPAIARAAFNFLGSHDGKSARAPSLRPSVSALRTSGDDLGAACDALRSLLRNGVSASDILVVSMTGLSMDRIRVGLPVTDGVNLRLIHGRHERKFMGAFPGHVIRCCDLPGAKGRESAVVMLIDLPDVLDEEVSAQLYVAMTRCTESIIVVGSMEVLSKHAVFLGMRLP